MEELPIKLKKYFSKEGIDTSTTVSYWIESHKQEKGGLGLFVSMSGSNGFSIERIAKFMWDSFRESYLDASSDPTSSLKLAMKDAQKRLLDLIKNEQGISDSGLDVHICGVVIVDEKILLSKIGGPEVLLIRDNKIINISESLPGYETAGYKFEIPVGSFQLRKSDIFLFSTPKLAQSVIDFFDGEPLLSWDKIILTLDSFAEGLVGSQYMWVIGFRIDDTPKFDFQRPDDIEMDPERVENIEKYPEVELETEEIPVKMKGEDELAEAKKPFNIKTFFGNAVSKIKQFVSNIDFQSIKRNIGSKVSSFKLRGISPRRMFVQKSSGLSFDSGAGRKKIIGIGLIVLIVVIVILSVRAQNNRKYNEEIDKELDSVESDIEEVEDIWKSDEMQANELLSRIDESISDLEDKELNGDQSDKLDELRDKALAVNDQMNLIVAVEDNDNYEILMETYLEIGESANVTDISYFDGYLYMVDNSSHAVYQYDLESKGTEAVADSKDVLKEPVLMAVGDKYIFVYDNKLGMLSLDLEVAEADRAFDTMPELSARTIEDVTDIETFGDNIYILKVNEARVLKSYPAGLGYSYPEEYFRHGAFDKATDLMIDGNIYVLSNGSDKVYKFYGGTQDQFALSGLDKSLGDVRCGFTNISDSKPLYVYDKENERIVVIEKGTGEKHPGQGVMIRQYIYRGGRDDILKDVKEIVVDAEEKYMYLLDGTKILRIEL